MTQTHASVYLHFLVSHGSCADKLLQQLSHVRWILIKAITMSSLNVIAYLGVRCLESCGSFMELPSGRLGLVPQSQII